MAQPRNFIVKAGSDKYPVIFTDARGNLEKALGPRDNVIIISNPTVYALHGQWFTAEVLSGYGKVTPILMGDGERFKIQTTVNRIYEHLLDIGADRNTAIIAFGGGVVGDTAGFVASTYMRGVPLVQVPTTLLAMVDSSIGGKTAINHKAGKNLIGTFYQPCAVLVQTNWLETLGHREIREGLAEIIKMAMLSTKAMVKEVTAIAPTDPIHGNLRLYDIIYRTMKYKASIVARDCRETGMRAILNLGHTFAHAIEKVEGYRRYRHGEAVMAGLVGALRLSRTSAALPSRTVHFCLERLSHYMSSLAVLKKRPDDYIKPMYVDKKNSDGRLRFILLKDIGQPLIKVISDENKVLDAVRYMMDFVNHRGII